MHPGELITVADEGKRETILTPAEEKVLLAACATNLRRHVRVLVIAALDTGARQGELLKLRWSDIAFDEGVIKNVTSRIAWSATKTSVRYPPMLLTRDFIKAVKKARGEKD